MSGREPEAAGSPELPALPEIERLAREAGAILRAGFRRQHRVDSKGAAIDLVTEMDEASERFLLGQILARFPDHRIVTEESGVHGGEGRCSWLIDPLDGTVNYAHGIPIYSVSVAFAVDGQVVKGAVYDPSQDECFSAERGRGAQLNGAALRTSSESDLARSLLVTGFPYDIWTNPQDNLDHFARFARRTRGVRRLGSAALDLCYVAAGRFDGFWELRLKAWDVAAGALAAEEAGARVSRIDGSDGYLQPETSILAANPALHTAMLEVLRSS